MSIPWKWLAAMVASSSAVLVLLCGAGLAEALAWSCLGAGVAVACSALICEAL